MEFVIDFFFGSFNKRLVFTFLWKKNLNFCFIFQIFFSSWIKELKTVVLFSCVHVATLMMNENEYKSIEVLQWIYRKKNWCRWQSKCSSVVVTSVVQIFFFHFNRLKALKQRCSSGIVIKIKITHVYRWAVTKIRKEIYTNGIIKETTLKSQEKKLFPYNHHHIATTHQFY